MGYNKVGFRWTPEMGALLKGLVIRGLPNTEITNEMSTMLGREFTISMIENRLHKMGFTRHRLIIDKNIKIYKELTLPDDNYMVSCDEHAPYHSEIMINRKLAMADKFRVTKNIQIGDTLDFDFIKSHPKIDGEDKTDLDKELLQSAPSIKALLYFKENYLLRGNHEYRVSRYTNSLIQAEHLYQIFGEKVWNSSFKYSNYDKMNIGKKWMVVHPKSYSQISTSVAKRLAEKFHRNVINSHGHLVGMAYDRSGKFLCVDLGGMFEKSKISYINLQTTSHPMWKNGFGMLYNGHFYHFTDETDWSWWL